MSELRDRINAVITQTEQAWLTSMFNRNRKRPPEMFHELRAQLVDALETSLSDPDATPAEARAVADLREQLARTLADFMGDSQNWPRYLDPGEATWVSSTAAQMRQEIAETSAEVGDLESIAAIAEELHRLATDAGRIEDHSDRISHLVGFYVPVSVMLRLGSALEARRSAEVLQR
jgi:hypothetical protein